jgi:hypothetical protein
VNFVSFYLPFTPIAFALCGATPVALIREVSRRMTSRPARPG